MWGSLKIKDENVQHTRLNVVGIKVLKECPTVLKVILIVCPFLEHLLILSRKFLHKSKNDIHID